MKRKRTLTYPTFLVVAVVSSSYAQEKPFTQPGTAVPVPPPKPMANTAGARMTAAPASEPHPVDRFFTQKLSDVIARGKFNLNVRMRYEWVDQTPFQEEANAATVRTRFGYTTAPLYGFQGMLEGENITVIRSERNYNAAGSNETFDRPVVADLPTTEINQAWLSYSYTNWVMLKGGRQRIALDNHRFIGDVGWRQNMQTFDAVTFESKPLDGLSLFYGYLWEVNRVFGDVEDLPHASPNRDFDSDSHLINISYSTWDYARFVGYSYLLDLENPFTTANSSATYGGYVAGTAPVHEKVALGYRGEFAYQTDYAQSTLDYSAIYYNVELNATVKPVSVGAGYEVLGADEDAGAAFRTPLATLHAFNGWADVFLNTPAQGLRDLYGFAQVTLPGDVPLRAIYHKYCSDVDSVDLGQEFNVVASKKFGKHWTALLKYAYYDGKEAPVRSDVHKAWAQVEFNF